EADGYETGVSKQRSKRMRPEVGDVLVPDLMREQIGHEPVRIGYFDQDDAIRCEHIGDRFGEADDVGHMLERVAADHGARAAAALSNIRRQVLVEKAVEDLEAGLPGGVGEPSRRLDAEQVAIAPRSQLFQERAVISADLQDEIVASDAEPGEIGQDIS